MRPTAATVERGPEPTFTNRAVRPNQFGSIFPIAPARYLSDRITTDHCTPPSSLCCINRMAGEMSKLSYRKLLAQALY
jgi:hypothetical protein